jgi:hypothetical protein
MEDAVSERRIPAIRDKVRQYWSPAVHLGDRSSVLKATLQLPVGSSFPPVARTSRVIDLA